MAAGIPVALSNSRPSATQRGAVFQGVAVPNAAGANPTKAEFDALLVSLRNAGVIAT